MAKVETKAPETQQHQAPKKQSQFLAVLKRIATNPTATTGAILLLVIILACAFANVVAPYGPNDMDYAYSYATPCAAHLLGCDALGRDLLSRMLYGGRYSLSLGIIVSLIHAIFGVLVGSWVGYKGGQVDNIVMRVVDVLSSIPGNILTIVLATIMEPGYVTMLIALTVSGLPGGLRGPRAMALKERSMEYLEAAQSVNASKARIIYKHMVPNILAPTIVGTTMGIGGTIMSVAGLAYIGLGVQPPTPEWGAMISDGRNYILNYPHLIMIPGIIIAITVLATNLFGDGLRDALDPKLKD